MRVIVEVGGCVDDGLLHVSGGVCSMHTMGMRVGVGGCVDDGLLHVSGGVCSMYTMGVRVEVGDVWTMA